MHLFTKWKEIYRRKKKQTYGNQRGKDGEGEIRCLELTDINTM